MNITQKIKTIRKAKGLTLQQLADRTELSKGYLSKIERAIQPPSISSLLKISHAMAVDISEFFEVSGEYISESGNLEIVKAHNQDNDNIKKVTTNSVYTYRPLLKSFKNKYMAPFLMEIKKGKTQTFSHDSEEFLYVIKGAFRLYYERKQYELSTGDSYYINARIKHSMENNGTETAMLLGVAFEYKRF